jgi:hypothetical protein
MANKIERKEISSESKTWVMTIGVVFEYVKDKEDAMEELQQAADEFTDGFKMIEVIDAKEATFSFEIKDGEQQ